MTHSESRQTLIAINSTEWLNLCARGSIRMSKRRPVVVSVPATNREMEKVFVSAPFTKMGSSVDLFVLVIDQEWPKSGERHRSNPSEVLQLTLSDVITHYPVALTHLEYYSHIGDKCNVQLSDPIFEQAWLYWETNETVNACTEAANRLQLAFAVPRSIGSRRVDKYKWDEIAKLILRPNEPIKPKPAHAETLLSNLRRLADAVSSARDSEQFYIACAIEWIDIRLAKDPMKKKVIKDQLRTALAAAKELPLGTPSEQTILALNLLVETYPKAFTDELTPITIAHIIQLTTDARTKKLKIHTLLGIVSSVDRSSQSSTLTTFVLAASLGLELTNQLILGMKHSDPQDPSWELPN